MINITKIQIDRLAHGAFTCGTLQRPDSFILPVEFPLVFNEVTQEVSWCCMIYSVKEQNLKVTSKKEHSRQRKHSIYATVKFKKR